MSMKGWSSPSTSTGLLQPTCSAGARPSKTSYRIHYDLDFGLNHDKNPSILVHGSWKQSVVPQYLKDWTLPKGWPWKAQFEHRAMLVPGDVLIMWGRVASKHEKGGMGFVELEIGMKTHDGIESMPGSATVVLPLKDGPDIPYPFVPPED